MEFSWPALPDWFYYPVVFIYGAIVGSFLNVVIYRMPLEKDLSKPPSHCPYCNSKLTFWENIPLVAFLFLRARCRNKDCRVPISWRYFCVELFTACVFTALYHQKALGFFNPTELNIVTWLDIILSCIFAAILIALVFIDLDYFIAPDQLNLFLHTTPNWLPMAVTGAITYGGVLFLVSLFTFMYYAREDDETVGQVFRRYFVEHFGPEEVLVKAEQGSVVIPTDTNSAAEGESEGAAPRLGFAPAFLCFLSALLTIAFLKFYAPLIFFIPLVAFLLFARQAGEEFGSVLARFFRSDDLAGPMSSEDSDKLLAMEEAQEFADGAEEGKDGGMGFGDVKLAFGIGALLGPGMAILSLLIATCIGAITGGTMAVMHRRPNLKLALPFVPFMAAGALVVMLYGAPIWDWYAQFYKIPEPPAALSEGDIHRQRKAAEREADAALRNQVVMPKVP
jgi:prepilin signal peptidase PulO-like enzyme (type II secretory pathway)